MKTILTLGLLLTTSALADSFTLTVTGMDTLTSQWMKASVLPSFQKTMQAQGHDVTVQLQANASSAEAVKQQYALDLRARRGADILSFDGFWIPEFVDAGLIKPLDVVVGKSALSWDGWKQIPDSLQNLLGYQGKLYGIGQGTDVRGIYYRKDLFKQAGLPVPWSPKSWADILQAARKLKALSGVTPLQVNAGTPMGEATTLQGYDMLLLGTNTQMYNSATRKWVVGGQGILDSLNFYKTVYLDEHLGETRWQQLPNGRDLSFAAFAAGKLGIILEGDYLWRSVLNPKDPSGLKDRDALVAFAPMPAQAPGKGVRGQNFVTISGGTGFILNPSNQHPREAWALLTLMNSKAMTEAFQTLLPRIRIRQDVGIPGDPVMNSMAKTLLPLTVTRPQLPAYDKVSQQVQLMTERVVSAQMSPAQALAAYASAVKQIVGDAQTESK